MFIVIIVDVVYHHLFIYSILFMIFIVKAKFHYAIQVASGFEAGSKLVADLQRAEIWLII